jgi:hypothetical protein
MFKIKYTEEFGIESVLDGEIEIDNEGRIWRLRLHKRLSLHRRRNSEYIKPYERIRAEHKTSKGYLQVSIIRGKNRYHVSAHRLVYRYFYGKIPEGLTINHINGIKDDNRPSNLELATLSQQGRHSIDVLGKTFSKGSDRWNAKLTSDQILEIRKRANKGEKQRDLAKEYRVCFQHISGIVNRRYWAWIE